MTTYLKLIIIFTLLKKIHPEGCSTNGGKLVCQNVKLEKSNPLAVSNYKVWSIDFDYCTIPVVPAGVFHNFDNTTVVWLDNSEVRTIEPGAFEGMARLQVLHLESNAIMELKPGVFDGLENLESINLDGNHLLKLNRDYFSNLPSLTSLRLEDNNIKSITENAFEGLPKLKNLRLRHNLITHLEKNCFAGLNKLSSLDLSHNFLTGFDCELLDNSRSLSMLRLDHNNLTSVSKNCFRALTSLEELYLNDNKLEKIDAENVFSCLPQFSLTSLNNNAWTCNSLLDTVRVLKVHNVNITDAGTTNTTNVYGIVCKWNYEDIKIENAVLGRCNGSSDLSFNTTIDLTSIQFASSTEMVFETETSENSASETTSGFTPMVSANYKEYCGRFSTTAVILLMVVVLLLVTNVIFCVLLCRVYRRRENSYKVKNNMAMMAL